MTFTAVLFSLLCVYLLAHYIYLLSIFSIIDHYNSYQQQPHYIVFQIEYDLCQSNVCLNGGECKLVGTEVFCDCLPQYTGKGYSLLYYLVL